jgi:hypothetical protein
MNTHFVENGILIQCTAGLVKSGQCIGLSRRILHLGMSKERKEEKGRTTNKGGKSKAGEENVGRY